MLLGPPRVEHDGIAVAFDTRKAMALLAHLALIKGPRTRDVLAELLWPGHDTAHARGALRRTLSVLRGAVGADALDAKRDHVALVRGPGLEIDVDRFRADAAAGRLEAAADRFRGDFLEGFGLRDAPAFEDWQRGEADALRRELAGVLARLAEATGELSHARRWLELDPLHEPAHCALMRIYAALGDRAAALAQYRECVRSLSRELGVPPLTQTTELYEAISEGTLETPSAPHEEARRVLPAAPLVGREAEWAVLLDLWAAIARDGRVAVIEGEPGIGKTRLAEELVAYARERGAAVLACRAFEEENALAYGPLVDALRGRLREDDGWPAAVPERALAEAARLLGEIDAVSPPPLDGPAAQARFLDGVWTTIATAASGPVPGVLLVDDVHWADDATLRMLGYGLRRLEGRGLLVVLTWRTPFDHSLRRIAAHAGPALRLGRLSEDEVGELLRAARPSVDERLTERLYEETEGLPFLLVEYLNTLSADPAWPLPAGARELLLARLDSVSETGRQILAAAAVIGRSFDVGTVRAGSGRGDEETVAALEELVGDGLVREGSFEYDFAHEQLRALVYERTGLARRRLLHGRVADALDGPAAAIARHLRLAGRDSEAAEHYWRALADARALFANAEAIEHGRAAEALGYPHRAELHRRSASFDARGRLRRSAHLLRDRCGGLRAGGAGGDRAPARAGPSPARGLDAGPQPLRSRAGGSAGGRQGDPRPRLRRPVVDRARRRRPSTCGRARGAGSRDGGSGGRPARARPGPQPARGARHERRSHGRSARPPRRSLAIAEETGDQSARVAALNNLALAHRARGELGRALDLTRTALGAVRRPGRPPSRGRAAQQPRGPATRRRQARGGDGAAQARSNDLRRGRRGG